MVEYFSKSAVRGDENVSTCTIILIQKSPEGKDMTDIYDIILIFTGLLALTVNRAQEQNTVNILANFILSQRQYRASCVLYNSNVSLYSRYLLFMKIVHHSNQTIHSVTRYPALSKQWVYHITCLRVCLSTNIIKLLHSCKLTSLHSAIRSSGGRSWSSVDDISSLQLTYAAGPRLLQSTCQSWPRLHHRQPERTNLVLTFSRILQYYTFYSNITNSAKSPSHLRLIPGTQDQSITLLYSQL